MEKGAMDRKITFRTEIEFKGSVGEFQKVAATLVKLPIRLRAEWPPEHTCGCWPGGPPQVPDGPLEPDIVIGPIAGGIRDPHLHMEGGIALLDRKQFKEVITKAATDLAGKLAETADHVEAVGAIRNLARGT
jgi:hypothetical protein